MLLNTIKVPKNLHYLTDRLPKPTYIKKKDIRLDHSEERDETISNSNNRDSLFLPTISKKRSQNRLDRHGRSIDVRRDNSINKRYEEEEEPRSNLSKHSSVKHSNYSLVFVDCVIDQLEKKKSRPVRSLQGASVPDIQQQE
jgi:hypothetical protein